MAPGSPYDVNHTPNVSLPQFQNEFFAVPTFPAGTNAEALRARFSLANWGSQYTESTSRSWRPIPGLEDVQYLPANGDMRMVWPQATEDTSATGFVTPLVRNINRFLNAVGAGVPPPSGAQNPHQCMLVELSSTDPNVIITRSSTYKNMNVVNVSTFRRFAEISVVGLEPVSSRPRDGYLYLQTFNMQETVELHDQVGMDKAASAEILSQTVIGKPAFNEVEDVAALHPTYTVHAYHDTGEKYELEDGRRVPLLRAQTAFGYFAVHEGPLYGWDARLYGAEKLAENYYVIRVPNDGSAYIETAIQARHSASEKPLPDDGVVGCCNAVVAWLRTKGMIGRLLAIAIRFICRLLGQRVQ
jgi:hypothetical protein